MPKNQASPGGTGKPATLAGMNLGYNGYANPTMLSWKQWSDASNVISGQHGKLRRIRIAQVVSIKTAGYSAQNTFFQSLFNFRDPTPQEVLLADQTTRAGGGLLLAFNVNNGYTRTQRINPYFDPVGTGDPRLVGPWSRSIVFNTAYEMNGQVKQTGRGINCATVEGLGLDAPDASPGIVFSAGSIVKTVGRSYAFAWENVNKFNVGPPSPATAYVFAGSQANQQATLSCIEAGQVQVTAGTKVVQGIGTVFSPAWVGKNLWVNGLGNVGLITDVPSSSVLTLFANATATNSPPGAFMIYDQQATHLRLYATADGGALYIRMQRNQFVPSATTVLAAGLQFTDNDPTEPGATGSTFVQGENAQVANIPPPIGGAIYEYQSRNIVFKVKAAPQTVFYSNIENTTIGNPPECFGPQNQFTLPIGDASVNGCAGLPTGLIIWSDRHDMFKVTGTLQDAGLGPSGALSTTTAQQIGSQIQRLPYTLGCGSIYGSVVTDLGVIWITSDREVWLFTDNYAPRNVGRPVQDWLSRINQSRLFDARMIRVKRDDLNWVVLACSIDNSPANNKLLVLDLDMMASNGAPSFFVFDMSTNQPTWYLFDADCESVASVFDQFGASHLVSGGLDVIRDLTYRDGSFAISEDSVAGAVRLHALGNEDSHLMKEVDWIRFITNQDPQTLAPDGWSFRVDAIDDDVATFDAPDQVQLIPGQNSDKIGDDNALPPGGIEGTWPGAVSARKYEFSPAKFTTRSVHRYLRGRRFLITINFPSKAGVDYELLSIQLQVSPKRVV